MSSAKPGSRYLVLPLPVVQREAKKLLTAQQLQKGLALPSDCVIIQMCLT